MASNNIRVIDLIIHEATDLKNVAWYPFNQDPYVAVRALPSGIEVRTSHVRCQTLNKCLFFIGHHNFLCYNCSDLDLGWWHEAKMELKISH